MAGLVRLWMLLAPACALIFATAAAAEDTPSLEGAPDGLADAEARSLYDAGQSAYFAGRYEDALGHFQRAYKLSGRPEMLYNIGIAAERCREDQIAVEAYRIYLEAIPNTPNRDVTERRIAFLEAQLAREQAEEPDDEEDAPSVEEEPAAEDAPSLAPSPVAEPGIAEAPPGDDGGGPGAAPWIVVGGGAALAVTGGVLIAMGISDKNTVEDPPAGARWADSADAYDRSPKLLGAGSVLLPLGVAGIAAGVTWAVTGADSERSVSLRLSPTGATIRGTF